MIFESENYNSHENELTAINYGFSAVFISIPVFNNNLNACLKDEKRIVLSVPI
jgi:hypothetical protein